MSNIQNIYEVELKRICRSNLIGVRSGRKKDWYWRLTADKNLDLTHKLRLILSWRFGGKVLLMTIQELLYHTIEEYKRVDYLGFQGLKYGEYHC